MSAGVEGPWGALLDIFRCAAAPVAAAVHWVETQGYGGALGTAATQGNARGVLQSLPRLVPELLAKAVVVIEEADATPDAAASVSNCMWIQTLPSAMQADILTFLIAERQHFLSKDLSALASTLLATKNTDFWVRLAATNMLKAIETGNGDQFPIFLDLKPLAGDDPEFEEYNALPDWLEEYRGTETVIFSGLPPLHNHEPTTGAGEPQVQAWVTPEKPTPVGACEGDQVKTTSPPSEEISLQATLGKRKQHDGEPAAEAQEVKPTTEAHELRQSSEILPPETQQNSEALNDKEEESLAREALGDDLFARAKALGAALRAPSSTRVGLPPDIDLISTAPDLATFLKVAEPWLADDETTNLLVASLLGEQSGYARSTHILTHVLLPKLAGLQEPPSRVLGSAALQAGKAHPRATVDAVLLPLLLREGGASTVQCDVVNRVVKDGLSPDAASSLCNKLFCGAASACVWTEATIGVLHTLLSQRVTPKESALEGLVSSLEQASAQFSTSLKFGNLLFSLVTKHGPKLGPHKAALQAAAANTKTFLTKSVVAKLGAL